MKEQNLTSENARFLAFRILQKVEQGLFANSLIDKHKLDSRDRRLLTQLVYGTIRHQGTIDRLIPPGTPLANRLILRLAGFQLIYLDRIPVHAIVNESVELAKRCSTIKSARFINAILRRWARTKIHITLPNPKQDYIGYLSAKYSFPSWLVKRWQVIFGKIGVDKFCEFSNEIPPLIVRTNTLKISVEDLDKKLESKKAGHPLALEITAKGSVAEIEEFRQGLFQVQDSASMFAADLLDVRAGMKVLDLCAAPGGKTCQIAQLMDNKGEIIALDKSADKADLIKENCRRLGINIVRIQVADGKQFRNGDFDRVLIDAPCSNTGVLRRRIEARWRLQPEDFQRLPQEQLKLLTNGARLLKPGGKLVYSTCSIDPEENEKVVEKFLAENKKFKLTRYIKKIPYKDQMDGVYAASLTI